MPYINYFWLVARCFIPDFVKNAEVLPGKEADKINETLITRTEHPGQHFYWHPCSILPLL